MAVDMYIKVGDIKGESMDKAHRDEIDVLAWSWGVSQSANMHMGGGGGSGKVNVQDLSFTKYVDSASNDLLQKCCSGEHIKEATLVVRKAGGKAMEYITIILHNLVISSVSTGGSGGEDRLTENVSLNFAKVEFKYQPQGPDGAKKGGTLDATWNIETNTASLSDS